MKGLLVALAGGVGGAKLAWGLAQVLPPEKLVIVVNTGDDAVFHGLHVSPDLDTVMYTLAGIVNPEAGWGVADDTTAALGMLGRYGAPTWFRLGDRDLACHIRRTELLGQGWTLSQATRELCLALGVQHSIVPMSDDSVRTTILAEEGELPFQVYFVERRCEPPVREVLYVGAEKARPSPLFEAALNEAGALVFCPSNPYLSIDPILSLDRVRQRIAGLTVPRLAVSPIVGGEALKGPLAKMMLELGEKPSSTNIARHYEGLCDIFIIDDVDREEAEEILALGMPVEAMPIVMRSPEDKMELARRVCALAGY
ncbi:MAG: 2-phospho-L-lactate transferase [Chloroflexi bacterium]|nr:2-phospho-L-lactate transferase [Chloroflexota bacterium]